jgi:PAS domain S-box-containing protein
VRVSIMTFSTRFTTIRNVAFGLIVLAVVSALITVSLRVRSEMNRLQDEDYHSVERSFSQLEVEHLRAINAIHAFVAGETVDLAQVRLRFNIYFSRVSILSELPVLAKLPGATELERGLEHLRGEMDAMAQLIDQEDAATIRDMPEIVAIIEEQRGHAQSLALRAVGAFAVVADARRDGLFQLLRLVASLALVLTVALVGAFLVLLLTHRAALRAGQRTSQARARLETTIGASLDAVLVTDAEGRILDYNGAAEEVFGYKRDEVLGQLVGPLVMPEHKRERYERSIRRLIRFDDRNPRGGGLLQLKALRSSGEEFPVEVSVALATAETGPVVVFFIRDISEREQDKKALLRSRDEALAAEQAKSDFIAVMSHEMRTPLNGLMAAHDLIDREPLSEGQARFMGIARSCGEQLLGHVNDVLQIASIEAAAEGAADEQFDPVALIRNVADNMLPLASANGNSQVLNIDDLVPREVTGRAGRLRQVLVNLVGNAHKFTWHGEVTIALSCKDTGAETTVLLLKISDTGCGIAPDKCEAVFDDFVRVDASYGRETEGTGLGLSIARRLVLAMGGRIGVDSTPGIGSTFWVRLPCGLTEAVSEPRGKTAEAMAECPDLAGKQILVVEDNHINRTVLRELLLETGARVCEAVNGQDGVDQARAQRFDLIFMDFSMPVMDGLAACRAIRAGGICRATPVIGFTAHVDAGRQGEAIAAGMNTLLTKPVSRRQLHQVVAEILFPEQALPLIDMDHAAELCDVLGDRVFEASLARFLQETDAVMRRLRDPAATDVTTTGGTATTGAAAQVPRALAVELHNITGAAGTMGAARLVHAVRAVERCLQATAEQRAGRGGDNGAFVLPGQRPSFSEPATEPTTGPNVRSEAGPSGPSPEQDAALLAALATLQTCWQDTCAAFGSDVSATDLLSATG